MASTKAAWLDAKATSLSIKETDASKPGPNEVLVTNKAWAINPIDWKMQDYGAFIKEFPVVLGCDIAGTVESIGSSVTTFKQGDRVAAHALGLATQHASNGAFQSYTIVPSASAVLLPSAISFDQGCVFPLSVSTASHGLYSKDYLNLPYPSTTPSTKNKYLLLWGASSSVGLSALQLAVASGLSVITTSSPRNFELLSSLGAAKTFDYNSPSVIDDITSYLTNKTHVGAYDTVGDKETTLACANVLAKLGGGFVSDVLQPPEELPATVSAKFVFAPSVFTAEPEIGEAVWGKFLPEALKSGQFKALPKAKVVANGLEGLQTGLDEAKKGVSATKIVVAT